MCQKCVLGRIFIIKTFLFPPPPPLPPSQKSTFEFIYFEANPQFIGTFATIYLALPHRCQDQRLVLKIILSLFKTPKRKLKRNVVIKNCFVVLRFSEIRSQTKWCRSTRVKDAKWFGIFHQLDLQTRTLPEPLKRMQKHLSWGPDEKRIRDLHQINLETRHSDWRFPFSSFESLISLPYLIKR